MSTGHATKTVTQRHRYAVDAGGPDLTAKTAVRCGCRTTGTRKPSLRHSDMGDRGSTALSGLVSVRADPLRALGKALYRIPEAMELLSMSRTVIYEQMRAGRLRYVAQGSDRRITASAIADYVALLVQEAGRRSE